MTKEELLEFSKRLEIVFNDMYLNKNDNIDLANYYKKSEVDSKIAEAISLLKGGNLPENQDTLKELADLIVANSIQEPTQEEINQAVGV